MKKKILVLGIALSFMAHVVYAGYGMDYGDEAAPLSNEP